MVRRGEKEQIRKGEKFLEKENVWSTEEKKSGEGKGGKYLAKDLWRRKPEKKKEEDIAPFSYKSISYLIPDD